MKTELTQDKGQQMPIDEHQDAEGLARLFLACGCDHEHARDWLAAVDSYQSAIAVTPKDPLVRYFANNNLGYSLVQLGRFDEAEEFCEAAIEVNPDQYNAHKNLGLSLQGQGRWLDAAFCFIEATRLCPSDTRAWQHLEQLLVAHPALPEQSGELRDLVEQVTTALRKGPPRQLH